MDIQDKIWHDFIDVRFGDEYLSRYISRQLDVRKWFKIGTMVLSAGGIWAAFEELKEFTVVALLIIGIVQLLQLVENELIHSEKQIEELSKLRMLYYDHWNKLEELLLTDGISRQNRTDRFYELRKAGKSLQELDDKLNIKRRKQLMKKAEEANRQYLKTHYNV